MGEIQIKTTVRQLHTLLKWFAAQSVVAVGNVKRYNYFGK
jgi:hypothetical protein